jgi:hypothetical protein
MEATIATWFGFAVLMFIAGYVVGQKIKWVRSISEVL